MANNTNYNASSISWEQGSAAHRRNPSRYLGSDNVLGIRNQLYEIYDNAVDEMIRYARENSMTDYAKVYVEIRPDNSVVVEDFGNGIPCEVHPVYGEPAIYILCESDSSGGKGRGTVGYDQSDPSGVNGAGMAVSKSCCEYFELHVNSKSANGKYFLRYEKGERVGELKRIGDLDTDSNGSPITGTKIIYKYDPEVFNDKMYMGSSVNEIYSRAELENRIKATILGTQRDNLEVIFKYKDNETEYFSNKNIQISNILHGDFAHYELTADPDKFRGDLFIKYNPNGSYLDSKNIVNRMIMKKSTTDEAIVDILWNLVRKTFNQKDPRKLKELKGVRLLKNDFRSKLSLVYIMNLSKARYNAQTKNELISDYFIISLQNQLEHQLMQNGDFWQYVYYPYMQKVEEDYAWEKKRQKEEESRKLRELRKKEKSKTESTIQELQNNPLKYEMNKDSSDIVIKNSPKPESESTLVYVEGKSAGSDFNDLHKDGVEYPIAIAIAEGKMPNVAIEEKIDNKMTQDNILYCLRAGYKDIAIFTDADADGNHIKLLHLMQIYTFAREYLDNRRVYIVPAPYSSLTLTEPVYVNLYGEDRFYETGQIYTYSAKEHQSLVQAGARINNTFSGLADSSISLKELLIHRENWISVRPLTKQDIDTMIKVLEKNGTFKADFMNNVYGERLNFSSSIDKIKDQIDTDRDRLILAFNEDKLLDEPEALNYKTYVTKSGIYDEKDEQNKIERDFFSTHDFE